MDLTTYVTYDGNCAEALEHYCDVLGAEIVMMSPFSDLPDGSFPVAPEHKNRVLHARIMIGNTLVMASDSFPGNAVTHGGFSLSLNFETVEEARTVFDKLSQGGSVSMPLGETFWTKMFGVCKDKFGVSWMVNVDHTDQQ